MLLILLMLVIFLILLDFQLALYSDRHERAVCADMPEAGLLTVHLERVLRGLWLNLQGWHLTVIDLCG